MINKTRFVGIDLIGGNKAFGRYCWIVVQKCVTSYSLQEMGPGSSLEGMMLKLKLQYFGHLMRRVDSLEKTLMLGGIGAGGEGDNRGLDGWMASQTRWT